MFERFTKEARDTVVRAQAECRATAGTSIGTEHLLLALLGGEGLAGPLLRDRGLEITALRTSAARLSSAGPLDADALRSLGIDLDAVREAAEETFGEGALDAPPGHYRKGHIPFQPGSKKVLELALRHAVRLKHNRIGEGHLLLGLLHDEDTKAVALLKTEGVNVAALRDDMTRLIIDRAA